MPGRDISHVATRSKQAALRNKDDLADVPALLDQTMAVGGLLERKLRADDRPDGTFGPDSDELVGGPAHHVRPVRHQPAEVEALHADVASDEQCRVERLPYPGREADRDQGPERIQDLDARLEHRASDRVDHDICPNLSGEILVAVRLLRTERAGELAFLLGARRRDHSGAEMSRDLDSCAPDAACRGVDEHDVTRLDARLER